MTIVSIDFDIIMGPSIEFYNHFINDEHLFEHPLMQICNADLIHYNRLTKWIFKEIQHLSSSDIIFISNHHEIINYFPSGEYLELINIDHHHDIFYNASNDLNCGNWVLHAFENHLIDSYTWIHNGNSM